MIDPLPSGDRRVIVIRTQEQEAEKEIMREG
jgi:hypothetical protein